MRTPLAESVTRAALSTWTQRADEAGLTGPLWEVHQGSWRWVGGWSRGRTSPEVKPPSAPKPGSATSSSSEAAAGLEGLH